MRRPSYQAANQIKYRQALNETSNKRLLRTGVRPILDSLVRPLISGHGKYFCEIMQHWSERVDGRVSADSQMVQTLQRMATLQAALRMGPRWL